MHPVFQMNHAGPHTIQYPQNLAHALAQPCACTPGPTVQQHAQNRWQEPENEPWFPGHKLKWRSTDLCYWKGTHTTVFSLLWRWLHKSRGTYSEAFFNKVNKKLPLWFMNTTWVSCKPHEQREVLLPNRMFCCTSVQSLRITFYTFPHRISELFLQFFTSAFEMQKVIIKHDKLHYHRINFILNYLIDAHSLLLEFECHCDYINAWLPLRVYAYAYELKIQVYPALAFVLF